MSLYCYRCGSEIRKVFEDRRCQVCGAHIYGEPDGLGAGSYVGSFLNGGLGGVIGNTVRDVSYKQDVKTNQQIKEEYYNSDYYKFNQTPLETVFSDKGMIGEYAVEGWIKQTQDARKNYIKGPYAILYNLMIPEPDGSFQEIDMAVITEYILFLVEIKNRYGQFKLEHWSDKTCFMGGEETYNPIMQNNAHCVALQYYTKDWGDDIFGDMHLVNMIAVPPATECSITYDYDAYDDFVLSALPCITLYHNINHEINRQIEGLLQGQAQNPMLKPANINEIYQRLYKCCSIHYDRSMEMRYRDEYSENSQKHPWNYYKRPYKLPSGDYDNELVRENGVYMQVYHNRRWDFIDYNGKSPDMQQITSIKELMSFKDNTDAAEDFARMLETPEVNNIPNPDQNINNMGINDIHNMNVNNSNTLNQYEEAQKKDKKNTKIVLIVAISIGAFISMVFIIFAIITDIKISGARENKQQKESAIYEGKTYKELDKKKQETILKVSSAVGENTNDVAEIKNKAINVIKKQYPNTNDVVAFAFNNNSIYYFLCMEDGKYYEVDYTRVPSDTMMRYPTTKEKFYSFLGDTVIECE